MLKTKSCGVIVVLALSAIVGTGIVFALEEIEIQVAPATLNFNGDVQECEGVTVHADIPFAKVNKSCGTLQLMKWNETLYEVIATEPNCWADCCGNLVARFDQTDVAEDVKVGGVYDLALTGQYNDEEGFLTATDTLRVINEGK